MYFLLFYGLNNKPLSKSCYCNIPFDEQYEYEIANHFCAGGTFALYSLLCRNGRLSILPNQQSTDEKLSTYGTEDFADTWQSSILKLFFEKHPGIRKGLLIFVLIGTCMAIGDGVITPSISGS